MNSSRLTIVLALVLGLTLSLGAAFRTDATRPNWEFLPEMKRSPAAQAFEAVEHFGTGRALQRPVAGTIPRGRLPLHFTASKEDAVRAGEELRNPWHGATVGGTADDPAKSAAEVQSRLAASSERGAAVYRTYCQCCHGASGAGDGPVAQRGFPPPPPLPTGKSIQMKDGQLFHILTYGQGSMASMAAQLTRDQRWDVVNFVRALQAKAADAQPAATPDAAVPSPNQP